MGVAVAKSKPKDQRVEFRADAAWYKRVEAAAEHLGISVAAYLRMAAIEKIDREERRREPPERE